MKKMFLGALVFIALSLSISPAQACGKVTIAEMNWSSATLVANVDKFILTHGFGCETELIPGDTIPTGTSMIEKGEPDIAPEFWPANFAKLLEQGVKNKRLRVAGDVFVEGGEEGFWVPEYLVKKDPSLATIDGIKKNAKLFKHPEDPDLGAFVTCPAGWGCQIANGHLFKALKLADAGFEEVDPGSGAALAGTIANAYTREEAWFGYYWAPTAVLGKYKMVKVDFGSGTDKDYFTNCLAKPDCEDPKPSMFPPSPVKTLTTEGFAAKAPDAYAYLTKRGYKNRELNTLLAWMEDQQADGDVVMEHFLQNYEATWTKWVSSETAEKIKKAVNNL